jgi:hydroxyacylglutathione hydrolase
VAQAQRDLVRIGIDRPAAAAIGQPQQWQTGQQLATLQRATFSDLAAAQAARSHRLIVLDVRRQKEWDQGHVANASHIPFSDLPGRVGEIPPGDIWVYCHTGYRAIVAASILAAVGRRVVSIDDAFGNAECAGLRITRAAASTSGVTRPVPACAVDVTRVLVTR